MRALLLYPPLLDPTAGYHSLGYLKAFAARRGYPDVRVLDASIGAVRYVLRADVVGRVLAERRARQDELAGRLPELSAGDRLELAELTKLDLVDPVDLDRAVRVLRDPEVFYDYPSYRWAVERLICWMSVLGTTGVPGQFRQGYRLQPHGWRPSRTADLTDRELIARLNQPFQEYYDSELLPELERSAPDLVGLNLTFISQTPFALRLLQLIRRRLPATHLVVGGTETSDIYKYLADKRKFFEIFADADSCVIGEGESAFTALLRFVATGGRSALPSAVRLNPRRGAGPGGGLSLIHEDQRELPVPDFSDLDLDGYLSPHPYLYYSPARGCYWNRCAFCDYGLNSDSPTSPWRHDPANRVFEDLAALSAVARHVYLSVDVLAPATIHQLAERIAREGLDVRWGAEVRLERYWDEAKCRTLRDGGCTAISVGLESASQRVLDAMDKGTEVAAMARTIAAMAEVGIAVQVMAFAGFPSETATEAMQTVEFLAERRRQWTLGDVGEFVLTPGAIVARHPDQFGVHGVRPRDGDDIHRSLLFSTDTEPTAAERSRVATAAERLRVGDFDRPWVGGVDTPHSYFYHDRYGPGIVDQLTGSLPRRAAERSGPFRLNGILLAAPPGYRLVSRSQVLDLRPAPGVPPERYLLRGDGRLFRLPGPVHAALARLVTDPERQGGEVWAQAIRLHLVRPEP